MARIIKKQNLDDANKSSRKTINRRDKRKMMEDRWYKIQRRRRILGIIPELR